MGLFKHGKKKELEQQPVEEVLNLEKEQLADYTETVMRLIPKARLFAAEKQDKQLLTAVNYLEYSVKQARVALARNDTEKARQLLTNAYYFYMNFVREKYGIA